MSATDSDKALDLIDTLPVYLQDSPTVRNLIDPLARELQRVEDAGNALRDRFTPQNADNQYDMLAMWEELLGLPPRPAGVSLEQRQAGVMAAFHRRGSSAGSSWVERANALIGTQWSYSEGPGDYQLTVTIPYASTSVSASVVRRILQLITPAHLQLIVGYDVGFLLGISNIGDPL